MISAGVEGRLPHMTYPEPWRGQPKQPPEFLRPAPKPVPPIRYSGSQFINDQPTMFLPCSRYNGLSSTTANGTRSMPVQRPTSKYPSPPSIQSPVNLTQQHKDEVVDELAYSPYRLYTPYNPHLSFTNIYHQAPYAHHIMRPPYPTTTSLPMLETFTPTTPSINSSTFLSPPSTFSPPAPIKPGQSILRDKRTPPTESSIQSNSPAHHHHHHHHQQQHVSFKVPSGKEGSLKHRILTRPEETTTSRTAGLLDLQKTSLASDLSRRRLNAASASPPCSPKKSLNNNNTAPGSFAKGLLIQLANGELRRIEDMRTEDFVSSAERSADLRLADSTVVKIESHATGNATITLTYNQRRAQVEIESTVEHPYFVFGQGWASCNPERTQQCHGLKVHPLQVGDILISLTPKDGQLSGGATTSRTTATIITTATTTAMTARQVSVNTKIAGGGGDMDQVQPINLHSPAPTITIGNSHPPQSMSPDSLAARKRRWSAPDHMCEDDEHQQQQNVAGGSNNSKRHHRGGVE